jgi:2',3'-cyclic-nucleotide 2'-phosphodiesterase
LQPVDGPITVCGVVVTIDPATGLCKKIQPLRIGGILEQAVPV